MQSASRPCNRFSSRLPQGEQVARGMELMQILGVRTEGATLHEAEESSEQKADADVDVKVIVKHTFIEVIDPRLARMKRCLSDSDLPHYASQSAQLWTNISAAKLGKVSDAAHDLSDASTFDAEESSTDAEEFQDSPCCDNQGMCNVSMQHYMGYSQDAHGYDPSAFVSWWMSPDGTSYMSQQWAEADAADGSMGEWRTTVMLRNMPNNYTREMLLELVDDMGFTGCYDFAYLPIDFKSQAGLGYAFINFCTPSEALRCFEVFEGFRDWTVPSEKVGTVTWGNPYQGLDVHIERYQNSPVMHPSIPDEWKPILLENGVRIEFPPPTKPIKTPKMRQAGPQFQ